MAKTPRTKTVSRQKAADPKPKAKPSCKHLGEEVYIPVAMKAEPSDLATVESVARLSHRMRSDIIHEMLNYYLKRMMEAYAADRSIAKMAALRELCRAGVEEMLARGYKTVLGADAGTGSQHFFRRHSDSQSHQATHSRIPYQQYQRAQSQGSQTGKIRRRAASPRKEAYRQKSV